MVPHKQVGSCIIGAAQRRALPCAQVILNASYELRLRVIAGHISRAILERYSHIRVEAKRAALEALSGIKPESSGTVYGTVDRNVPVYSDLSPMNASKVERKKLEVATVP